MRSPEDDEAPMRPEARHAIMLLATLAVAGLTWPGADGDLSFWLYQIALVAVLVAGTEFHRSYMLPGPDGTRGRAALLVGLVQGTFFAAFILLVQAQGAAATPLAWVISGVVGGLLFGGLNALWPRRRSADTEDARSEFDAGTDRMADHRERLRLYVRPVLMVGVAPLFLGEGALLRGETGLAIYMLFIAAIAEAPPRFSRTPEAEAEAFWTQRRHLLFKLVPLALLGVVILT